MPQSFLVAIFSTVFLLLVAGAFLFIYFRSQLHEVDEIWSELLDKLRLRLDKIPNLIETLRAFTTGQDNYFAELIKLRASTWPLEHADKKRVHAELDVSDKLRFAWELQQKFPELGKDTNFLSLHTDFRSVSKEIDSTSHRYNERARRFNRQSGFPLIKPFLLILGFRKLQIFEFEE
ncbi:MAG TPA: LemA family protein [Candidatus Gracilibacteria bacterium]|nr:LemA family protein [Candidatus Gracilibacteria bacterium]